MIQFREEDHTYWDGDKQLPSVTQILDILSYQEFGNIDKATLEYASRRGTDIHEATEALDLGFPADVDGETEPYVRAYCDFTRDYRVSHLMIEEIVHDEEFGYCGTVDRYSVVGNEEWLIDIKTVGSPNRLTYVKLCCQTWMYAHALNKECHRYGLFLKRDGTYRLFDCKGWEIKNNIHPQEIVPQLISAYNLIQKVKGKQNAN